MRANNVLTLAEPEAETQKHLTCYESSEYKSQVESQNEPAFNCL